MKQRAFTLIELLVVIAIIALLASVVVASLNAARDKGRMGAAKQFAAQVEHVAGEQAVGVWDFDECAGTATTVDRSGFGFVGTLNNMATSSWSANTPTGTGCSLSFNGSNQSVTAPLSIPSMTAVTMAAWVYWTSSGATTQFVVGGGSGTEKLEMHMGGSGGSNGLRCIPTSGVYIDTGANKIPSNQWNFVACVYNPGSSVGKVYVNGAEVASVSASTALNAVTAFYIGARSNGTYYFSGNIDSVRVYTKDLTASEIGRLYAEGRATHPLAAK